MERKREYFVLALSVLSIIGMVCQMLKPHWCTGTASIMYIVGGNQLDKNNMAYRAAHITAAVVVAIGILGMVLFAISVYRGNVKGRLSTSYAILLLHALIMALASIAIQRLWTFNNESAKLNITIFFLSTLILILLLAVYIIREHGGMRMIPNLSALMLLVTFGRFIGNGLVLGDFSSAILVFRWILYGTISALPYFTIFVFEKFVLEQSMKRYR